MLESVSHKVDYRLDQRVPVYGWGINDAPVSVLEDGEFGKVRRKDYTVWSNIIGRVYYTPPGKEHPKYRHCRIEDKWQSFSNFKGWFNERWDVKRMTEDGHYASKSTWDLDKDLRLPHLMLEGGNRVYGPDQCWLIPSELNSLIGSNAASRGMYGMGIQRRVRKSGAVRYCYKLVANGNQYFESFSSLEEATWNYLVAKSNQCQELTSKHVLEGNIDRDQAELIRESVRLFLEREKRALEGSTINTGF